VFLPVLHERMVVSRHPWVTYSVIGLCVAVFLATHSSAGSAESERLFGEAVGWFATHPDARPDERLLTPELATQARELARAQTVISRPATGRAEDDPQAELDRRTPSSPTSSCTAAGST